MRKWTKFLTTVPTKFDIFSFQILNFEFWKILNKIWFDHPLSLNKVVVWSNAHFNQNVFIFWDAELRPPFWVAGFSSRNKLYFLAYCCVVIFSLEPFIGVKYFSIFISFVEREIKFTDQW